MARRPVAMTPPPKDAAPKFVPAYEPGSRWRKPMPCRGCGRLTGLAAGACRGCQAGRTTYERSEG